MKTLSMCLLMCLLVTACEDSSPVLGSTTVPGSDASTSTSAAAQPNTTLADTSTTAAPTTTTTPAPTTTTTPAPLQYPVAVTGGQPDFPPVLGASGDSHGSGCAPPGDVLPDGIWFGFAQAVTGSVITFDLGCFFTDPAASAAAAADGYGEVEEGFYIRNQNPKVFAVPIAPTAEVWWIDGGPTTEKFPQPLPLASWPSPNSWLPCPGTVCAVWLYVNAGSATGIVEQYLP